MGNHRVDSFDCKNTTKNRKGSVSFVSLVIYEKKNRMLKARNIYR